MISSGRRAWCALGLVAAGIPACANDKGSSSDTSCGKGTILVGNECVLAGDDAGLGGEPGEGSGGGAAVGSGGRTSGGGGTGQTSAGGTAAEGDGGAGGADASNGDSGAGDADASNGEAPLVDHALDCGSRDITGATEVSGPITQDTTWSGLVHVAANVSLRNEATLTIAPGTKIIVGLDAEIEFGWQDSHPTLVAAGTPEAPIVVCGETTQKGYWSRWIVQKNVNPASVMRNLLLVDGGGKGAEGALVMHAPILLQGVQVRGSGTDGVAADGFNPGSRQLIVKDSAAAPVSATRIPGVNLPPDSDLIGNGTDFIRIGFSRVDASASFKGSGLLPYRQLNDVTGAQATDGNVVVSLGPGVTYELADTRTLDFGSASVQAVGTAAAPVVFRPKPCTDDPATCNSNEPPRAGQIRIGGGSTQTRLEHVKVQRAGWLALTPPSGFTYTRHTALAIDAVEPVTLKDLEISDAAVVGLEFSGESGGVTSDSSGWSIGVTNPSGVLGVGDLNAAVLVSAQDCRALTNLPHDLSASPTMPVEIASIQVLVPTTVRKLSLPYLITGALQIKAPLTVEPGTIVGMRSGAYIVTMAPAGALIARGTAAEPILLVPVPDYGSWENLTIENPGTILDHVIMTSGGTGSAEFGPTGSIVAEFPLSMTNSTVSNSHSYGIVKKSSDSTDYLSGNTFTNNAKGDVGILN